MSETPPQPAAIQDALVLHQSGQLDAAAALYRQILAHQPQHFDALHLFGALHLQSGDLAAAETLIRQALAVNPAHGLALSNLALTLRLRGQSAEALAVFDRACAVQVNPETEFNRALLLLDLRRPEDALAGFDRAIAGAPRHVGAWIGRGNALERLGRLPEAVAAYDQARTLNPRSVEAHHNLGCALHSLGRLDEARTQFGAALQLNPDFAESHLVRAESHLLTGDFPAGWPEYEWRWRVDGMMAAQRREFTQGRWQGETIAGRTILLWAEQGFGDMFQFCRFATTVAARGARVLLEVPAEIADLMTELNGVAHVIRRGDPLPPFDVHCPLMSLPLALGPDAKPENTAVPYLRADARLRKVWQTRLGEGTERRVGIVWSGRQTHRNNHARSIALSLLAPLFAIHGLRFVCLQPDVSPDDLACGLPVVPGPSAFVESAALVDSLDLVITVDTAVAHLAGALGKPVWVLLPMVPDWRWQMGRSDSPWYPTARLFRQRTPGDWPSVIADVAAALRVSDVKA